jgi:hypothetical protein
MSKLINLKITCIETNTSYFYIHDDNYILEGVNYLFNFFSKVKQEVI